MRVEVEGEGWRVRVESVGRECGWRVRVEGEGVESVGRECR